MIMSTLASLPPSVIRDGDYQLSIDLPKAHDQDVKCLITIPRLAYQDRSVLFNLVSASRDKLVKLWSYVEAGQESRPTLRLESTFTMHHHFVNSLAWIPPIVELAEHGLIVSGGSDHLVHLYPPNSTSNEPCYTLVGHTENVCSLSYDTFAPSTSSSLSDLRRVRLLSGSWDKTARLWTLHKTSGLGSFSSIELKGHSAAVWSTLFLPNGHMMTGSADRSIRLWRDADCLYTFSDAHADVVRGLTLLSLDGGLLASTGNDGRLAVWNLESQTLVKATAPDSHFMYSLTSMADGTLVAGGEGGLVFLWSWSAQPPPLMQKLELACFSVWTLTALPFSTGSFDFAVGCNDGTIKVFTKEKHRKASHAALQAFASQVLAKSISGPGALKSEPPSSLLEPGQVEGQKKIVKQVTEEGASDLQVYSWSNQSSEWTLLGSVVSQPDEEGPADKEALPAAMRQGASVLGGGEAYQGRTYDHVFKIDVEEGRPPLDLPFNKKDNPYVAAQNFIAQHQLPISYLDQIVQFIVQNSGGSGEPSKAPSTTTAQEDAASFRLFSEYNKAGIIKKLHEYNGQQSASGQYDRSELETIEALLGVEDPDGPLPSLLARGLTWSLATVFPILDLYRMTLSWSPDYWQADQIRSVVETFQTKIMAPGQKDVSSVQRNGKLIARFLINLFHVASGQAFILASTRSFLSLWRSVSLLELGEDLKTAFSHNYSLLAAQHPELYAYLDQLL